MKKLALISIVLGATLALTPSAFAQAAGPTGGAPAPGFGKAAHRGPMMIFKINKDILASLNLTDDQKAKVAELDKTTRKNMAALRKEVKAEGANVDKAALKTKHQALMKEYRQGLMAILTDAQQQQYKTEFRAAMQKLRAARKPKAPANP